MVGVAYGSRMITIVVNTNGSMSFQGQDVSWASSYISLDGVSFGI
jgi:hypothetical protein